MRTTEKASPAPVDAPAFSWAKAFTATVLAVTLWRLATLALGAHELGPDEAQYWFWSLTPDAGYYSKPPLIAWTIAATTALFGDGEAAARMASPLFHAGTAAMLFLLARDLYGPRAGFWAGLTWLLLPGIIVSSGIISTDPPMLTFWSLALWAFFQLGGNPPPALPRAALAALLGAALGLGFLSKYAIVYFPIGVVGALIVSREMRRAIRARDIAIAAVVAAGLAAPNVAWNAANDFQTISHTAANANLGTDYFHPVKLLEFLGAQFGIAGPLILIVIVASVLTAWGLPPRGVAPDAALKERERALTFFVVPALAIISVEALVSRAHANWAAAAYPAAVVLAVGVALRVAQAGDRTAAFTAIRVSAAGHALACVIFSAMLVAPGLADGLGLGGAFKPLRGWRDGGERVAEIAARAAPRHDAIVADDRDVLSRLIYYAGRDERLADAPFRAFDSNIRIDHHYEAFHRFDPTSDDRILYITENFDAIALKNRFDRIERIDEIETPLSPAHARTLYVFEAEGYLGH